MTVLVRPPAPLTARWATAMWLLAVAAGVAESVVGIIGALHDDLAMPAIAVQIAVRSLIYGALFVVIDRYFRHGTPWSRYLLAGLLGTVGIASLVVDPITWLLDHDLTTLDLTPAFLFTAALRAAHLTAVLTALLLTFHPDTNHWFHNQKTA